MLRPYKSTTIVTKHDFFLIHSLSIHPRLNHVCCMLLQCHQQFAMRSVCPPYRVPHHVAPILPLTLHLFKSFVGVEYSTGISIQNWKDTVRLWTSLQTHNSVKVENIGLSLGLLSQISCSGTADKYIGMQEDSSSQLWG